MFEINIGLIVIYAVKHHIALKGYSDIFNIDIVTAGTFDTVIGSGKAIGDFTILCGKGDILACNIDVAALFRLAAGNNGIFYFYGFTARKIDVTACFGSTVFNCGILYIKGCIAADITARFSRAAFYRAA